VVVDGGAEAPAAVAILRSLQIGHSALYQRMIPGHAGLQAVVEGQLAGEGVRVGGADVGLEALAKAAISVLVAAQHFQQALAGQLGEVVCEAGLVDVAPVSLEKASCSLYRVHRALLSAGAAMLY
jgi:hypothetical protein